MTNYYMVSYHAGDGIYCTNLATAENVEDIQRAYADHEQVTINTAKDYEIESAKRRGMPVVECEHVETETETNEEENTMEEKNYDNIRAAIASACEKYVQNMRRHMTEGEHAENVLERNSTPTRWNQYKAGTIDRAAAVEYAMQRVERAAAKSTAAKLAKLDAYAAAAPIVAVEIYVRWTKSRTWGYNPTATVYATDTNGRTHTATGTASGCGYDKRSAAVCEALNKITGLNGMLCAAKNAKMTAEDIESAELNTSNEKFLAYGAGYGSIPYFEGGCGMSSTESALNAIGLNLKTWREPTRGNDVYTFETVTA